jgi:phosphatidylethanolamine/phosphatidyl-N-methylethanolamine N-methyltransferase
MPKANRWNRFIYALWSPFYDLLINLAAIRQARRRAFDVLALRRGERVCLIGVGTGADFPFLPEGISAAGVDLSKAMLAKARRKLPLSGIDLTLQQANAEQLPFADESFDVAVLTLILSVAADGAACLQEAARITRSGARLLVLDKFSPPAGRPSLVRRLLNPLTRTFGTNINRSFEDFLPGLPLRVLSDQPVLFGGAYRAILLTKEESAPRRTAADTETPNQSAAG